MTIPVESGSKMADQAYRGLIGAYRYAFRRTDSWLLRLYIISSAVLGVYLIVLLGLGLISWLADPVGRIGQRALLGVILLLILLPLTAPVLITARRYRLETTSPAADPWLGVAGGVFVLTLFVGLLIADPSEHSIVSPLQNLMTAIDTVPGRYWIGPPIIGLAWLVITIRATGRRKS